ncbi:hypothetical protein Aduo_011818 [Ancylostoma duodenale]
MAIEEAAAGGQRRSRRRRLHHHPLTPHTCEDRSIVMEIQTSVFVLSAAELSGCRSVWCGDGGRVSLAGSQAGRPDRRPLGSPSFRLRLISLDSSTAQLTSPRTSSRCTPHSSMVFLCASLIQPCWAWCRDDFATRVRQEDDTELL